MALMDVEMVSGQRSQAAFCFMHDIPTGVRRRLAFFMVLPAGGGWRSVSWISSSTCRVCMCRREGKSDAQAHGCRSARVFSVQLQAMHMPCTGHECRPLCLRLPVACTCAKL